MDYLHNLEKIAENLKPAILEAGNITTGYFKGAHQNIVSKSDGSPVTLADREAEAFLEKAIFKLTPGLPIVGEESFANGRITDLNEAETFWLLDPLDGTKEFISGSGEYTINIALIHKNRPVLGLVYAPVQEDLYISHGPGTARRYHKGRENPVRVRAVPKSGLTVVVSRRHGNKEKLEQFLNGFELGIEEKISRGSSLKICSIANGEADLYPRFGPTCEWDTAAAHAILDAAGGALVDAETGKNLTYGHNRENKWLNPEFIAANSDILEARNLFSS